MGAAWPRGQSRNLFRARLSLAWRIPAGKTAGADESALRPCRCAAPDDSRWRVSHVGAAFAGGGVGGAGAAEDDNRSGRPLARTEEIRAASAVTKRRVTDNPAR